MNTNGNCLNLTQLRAAMEEDAERTFGKHWNKRVLTSDQIAERNANQPARVAYAPVIIDPKGYLDLLIDTFPEPQSEFEARLVRAKCEGIAERNVASTDTEVL